jgi:hypothetical protein
MTKEFPNDQMTNEDASGFGLHHSFVIMISSLVILRVTRHASRITHPAIRHSSFVI